MVSFCCICGSSLPNKRVSNPHNPRDEFCSQECAKQEREGYLATGPKNYLLYGEGSTTLLGVYRSWTALIRGSCYQLDINRIINQPLGKLYYEVWIDDYPHGAKEWGYVPELMVTFFRKNK